MVLEAHNINRLAAKNPDQHLSGGIFLPRGINSTSDWLLRYRHRAGSSALTNQKPEFPSAWNSQTPGLQQPITFWVYSARQKGSSFGIGSFAAAGQLTKKKIMSFGEKLSFLALKWPPPLCQKTSGQITCKPKGGYEPEGGEARGSCHTPLEPSGPVHYGKRDYTLFFL